uniref:Distal membrane arm assembly component 2 n=1 Tax=Homo sapiens TaxID=9606 RepID=M0QX81_HUMAN
MWDLVLEDRRMNVSRQGVDQAR